MPIFALNLLLGGWRAVLAFARSPIGRWVLIAVAGLAIAGGLYAAGQHAGVKAERAAEAARLAQARKVVARRESVAAAISTKAAAALEKTRVEIRTRTITLTKEIPSYVTSADDARCIVPVGFVQLHDAAAAGVPAPAGGPVDSPSGVQLSAVLATVVGNYGAAYDWRAEALTWRKWYADQKAAWDASP